MVLTKCKLGEHIELRGETNASLTYGLNDVRGVNNLKKLMQTKADMNGRDLSKFQIVYPGEFVFNHRTSRNGSKFSIAYNDGDKPIICTEDYVVFRVKKESLHILSAEWLYMYFNRSEFDRYVITNSWGSSTEFYNWEDICAIELELPTLEIQQKNVDIYNAIVANQQSYERGLEDLKLALDAYVENARRVNSTVTGRTFVLGDLIEQRREKYDGSEMPIRGVSKDGFVEPRQPDADLGLYNQYYYNDFVFNPARMELNSIQLNSYFEKACCSSLYEVFYVKRLDVVLPEYLNLLLKRREFARWCEYVGWGSAREYCRVDTISQYPIVVPSIEEQKSVVGIYKAYMLRSQINEQLKAQIKDICPILIRGSLEDNTE